MAPPGPWTGVCPNDRDFNIGFVAEAGDRPSAALSGDPGLKITLPRGRLALVATVAKKAKEGAPAPRGGAAEVFAVALGLGLTSFGGPIAHLGYFERAYVERRRWLSADDYAGLVALCQMAPGPASSQVGFLVGLRRAGWSGAFAAWLGFTLPSAALMFAFARLAPRLTGPLTQAALHGLKLVAVAVVAQAVWSMGRRLCPDLRRAALGLLAAAMLLLIGGPLMQLLALVAGAVGGVLLCRDAPGISAPPKLPIGRRTGLAAGGVFLALLVGLPLAAQAIAPRSMLAMTAIFYKAGALVFGGGHVVLPLLRDALVPTGWVSDGAFLSGYGAAQAVPGPLFTFAAYLGAVVAPPGSGVGASLLWSIGALAFLFLPGLLVALAGVRLWTWIGGHPTARGALAGVNAAVVGVLGAALYDPIWTSAILGARDLAVAVVAFMLLERWRVPPILIVAFCVVAAVAMALAR
jgi:chromate transporter